jgi:hypothetical protein
MKNNKDNRNQNKSFDASKAMDSKKEVEQSPDQKTDQDFPGYPHYPAKEDIMDQRTDNHRVDMNVENLASGPNASGINERFSTNETNRKQENLNTEEEIEKVDTINQSAGSPERNDEIGTPQNISNEDLDSNGDRPGTNMKKAAEE